MIVYHDYVMHQYPSCHLFGKCMCMLCIGNKYKCLDHPHLKYLAYLV